MKKSGLLLLAVFIITSLQAQKLERKDLFNRSKIESFLANVEEEQSLEINTAIKLRIDEVKLSTTLEEKKEANKKYCTRLIEILTDLQEEQLFGALVNIETVRSDTEKERYKIEEFPTEYGNWMLEELEKFNYQIRFLFQKYAFDLEQQSIKRQAVASKKREFIQSEKYALNNVKSKVRRIQKSCDELSLEQFSVLTAYHFYISKDQNKVAAKLKEVTESEILLSLIEKISEGVYVSRIENNEMIRQQDSITRASIKFKIKNQFKVKLNTALANLKPLEITTQTIIKTTKKEVDSLKQEMKFVTIAKNVVGRMENDCTEFSDKQLSALINYHVSIFKSKKGTATKLNSIIESESFLEARDIVANCAVLSKIKNKSTISKQDSITQQTIKLKIKNQFIDVWNSAVANSERLHINTNTINANEISSKIIEAKKENSQKEEEIGSRELFLTKAKKAGLDKVKTEEILLLIEERNTAIEDYKKSRSNNDDQLFSITETSTKKRPYVIKKEFAEKLSNILSYKEFSLLIGSDFRKKSKNQATEEVETLIGDKEMSKEDIEKLYKCVFKYFYHHNITEAYYSHDKKKSRQKLGVLTYRFEKEYNILAKELELNIDATKKINNRTFQWN